jgi:predicted nucleic acid-binding protein
MIVISDSTPLITLMKADRLDLLKSLFGEVLLPEAVFAEVTSNEAFRDEADLIRGSDYIKVVKVADPDRVAFLQRVTGLDRGESEAIVYADESKADLLLMDEAAGRKVAQNMKLPMTGSVGILVRAYQGGMLTEEEIVKAFDRIRESNRHISEKLIQSALTAIHNKK